jgi:hypothetical protein
MYSKLNAAIAAAASCNGRHAERIHMNRRTCELCVARGRARIACADELLPAVLGGEWMLTKGAWPPIEEVQNTTVFDHWTSFRRRGMRGPCSWRDGAIVWQPYNHVFRNDVFYPPFVARAQTLADRYGVGVWVSPELSFYYPGSSVLVLLARGLAPERAARFGFVPCLPAAAPSFRCQ